MTSIVPGSSPAPLSAPAPTPQTAASPALRFGKKHEEDSFTSQNDGGSVSSADRIKGALMGAVKAIFQPKSLALDTLIAVAITVATAWLPGSQLLTIPAFLAISAALRAVKGGIQGYQNPGGHHLQQSSNFLMFPVSSN
jgi:hypothetical protein